MTKSKSKKGKYNTPERKGRWEKGKEERITRNDRKVALVGKWMHMGREKMAVREGEE